MISRLLAAISKALIGAYPRWMGSQPEARQLQCCEISPVAVRARAVNYKQRISRPFGHPLRRDGVVRQMDRARQMTACKGIRAADYVQ